MFVFTLFIITSIGLKFVFRMKKKVIGEQTREIIFRVYLYFATEANKFKKSEHSRYFNKIQARVAKATGVSAKTVYQLLKSQDMTVPLFTGHIIPIQPRNNQEESHTQENYSTEVSQKPGPSKVTKRKSIKKEIIPTELPPLIPKPSPSKMAKRKCLKIKTEMDEPPPLIPLPMTYVKPDPDYAEPVIAPIEMDPQEIKQEHDSDSDS